MESPYQSLSLPFWKTRKTPYISVIHDGKLHEGEDGFIQSVIRKFEYIYASAFVVLTDSQKQILEAKTSKPIFKSFLPATGARVGSRAKTRIAREHRESTFQILFFGRLQEYKGVQELIQAAEILDSRGLKNIEVVIRGDGPLRELATTKIREYLTWDVRWIDDQEIEGLFEAADIVVLPYQDGSQSGVVTYCQKTCVPMVITPVAGLVEQVSNGGALVAKGVDATAIADAIETCIKDTALLQVLERELIANLENIKWPEDWARDLMRIANASLANRK